MNCKKCGAELLETDSFCVKCGEPVENSMFCPQCGELLREGTLFCHNCGTKISSEPEDEEIPVTPQKTIDIPFELIEKSIMMEAEQAIEKRAVTEQVEHAKYQKKSEPQKLNFQEMFDLESDLESDVEPDVELDSEPDVEFDIELDLKSDMEFDEEPDRLSKITKYLGFLIVFIALFIIFFLLFIKGKDEKQLAQSDNTQTIDKIAEEDSTKEEEPGIAGEVKVLKAVNIRNKANKDDSVVLGVANPGETYAYYELVAGAWYHIALPDGTDGYVYCEYVEEISE